MSNYSSSCKHTTRKKSSIKIIQRTSNKQRWKKRIERKEKENLFFLFCFVWEKRAGKQTKQRLRIFIYLFISFTKFISLFILRKRIRTSTAKKRPHQVLSRFVIFNLFAFLHDKLFGFKQQHRKSTRDETKEIRKRKIK